MKRLLLICGTALLLIPSAWAAHSQPLAFFTQTSILTDSAATGGCISAPDDYIVRDAVLNSALSAGMSVADPVCVLQTPAPRVAYTELAAASQDMVLKVSFQDGSSVTVPPVFDKRLNLWMYRSCTSVPTDLTGSPAQVVLTASNPSRREIAKIRYDWWVGAASGCQ